MLQKLTSLVLGLLLILVTGAALAADERPSDPFLRTEWQVLGASASRTWTRVDLSHQFAWRQIGGNGMKQQDEVGGAAEAQPENAAGSSVSTGTKVKAGLLSAVLPGAGQYYNDQHGKAYLMAGIEVGIWTAYFVFDQQGDNRMDSAKDFAGIYAGTSGSYADSYWQSVGKYMDSDAYNEALLREARALQEPVTGLITDDAAWQWVNEDRRMGYTKLRADGNSAYDRRDFMILFAVINRAVSVVDAVLGAGNQGKLKTEVLGMNLEMEMLPSLRNPGAQCVVSRRF